MANSTTKLKGICITCNYPDEEVDMTIPSEITVDKLGKIIAHLLSTEPDMTSLVVTAAVVKE